MKLAIHDIKQQIRQECLKKRSAIPWNRYYEKCKKINEKLQKLECIIQTDTIHCYIGSPYKREVLTLPSFIQWQKEDKKIYVPIVPSSGNNLEHHLLTPSNQIIRTKWDILEPKNRLCSPFILSNEPIIIPIVAVDRYGNRLGYGKGYYDRFLYKRKNIKIGLAFNCSLVQKIPTYATDISLDMLITENQIYIIS